MTTHTPGPFPEFDSARHTIPDGVLLVLDDDLVVTPRDVRELRETVRWLVAAFDAGMLTIRPDSSNGFVGRARTLLARIENGS